MIPNPTNTVIVEAVAETVLVAVVNPLGDPDDGLGLRVLGLVLHVGAAVSWLADDELLQLVVKFSQVTVSGPGTSISDRDNLIDNRTET